MARDKYNTIRLLELLDSFSLIQYVDSPTHVSGSMLDLVIGRDSDNIVNSVNVEDFLSDHAAVHCSLNLQKQKHSKREITYRKLKCIDHVKFALDISESDLLQNPKTNLEDLVNQYNTELSRILDKHAPVCKRTITIRPSKPWYNNEISEAKHYRKQLERKWRKTKSTSDRQLFVAQRLKVTRLIDQAKTDYYGSKITGCADDQKSLFKIVEQLLHNKGPEKFPTHNDSFHLAETFSSFFINKIVKIRDQLDIEENSTCLGAAALTNFNNEEPPVCNVLEEFVPLTEEEIFLIAKSPTKSCDLDPLPTSILKEHLDLLLPTITNIVNMSLTSLIFPQSMKTALVRPLLKKASLDQ